MEGLMSSQMDSILTYLQNIQHDLVGIIVPAIIAATVSLISLVVSSMISIIQEKRKYNHEQFKYMQKAFPTLKIHLQQMRFSIDLAKEYTNSFGASVSKALQNYHDFKMNEGLYRASHQTEAPEIDKFIYTMENYINNANDLHKFFLQEALPAMPLLHPFLKKDVYKMLGILQYWAQFLPQVNDTSIDSSFISKELETCTLNATELQKYIELLDKWHQAY